MNWYKKAMVDPTLSSTIFNILTEIYENPSQVIDVRTRLAIAPDYEDPITLADSLLDARNNFLRNTGEIGLTEAQEKIVQEIQSMFNEGNLQQIDNFVTEDFENVEEVPGGVYGA